MAYNSPHLFLFGLFSCGIPTNWVSFFIQFDVADVNRALTLLMLCAPVFIFTSGNSALLGRPRCGLSIWLALLVIFNTLFWVYANLFHEKTDKTREYSKSAIFVWYENGRRRLLGAQSINSFGPAPCCLTVLLVKASISDWLSRATRCFGCKQ